MLFTSVWWACNHIILNFRWIPQWQLVITLSALRCWHLYCSAPGWEVSSLSPHSALEPEAQRSEGHAQWGDRVAPRLCPTAASQSQCSKAQSHPTLSASQSSGQSSSPVSAIVLTLLSWPLLSVHAVFFPSALSEASGDSALIPAVPLGIPCQAWKVDPAQACVLPYGAFPPRCLVNRGSPPGSTRPCCFGPGPPLVVVTQGFPLC